MKKIFTLCLFVFGLFLVTNTANAQQKFSAEINNAAQAKTAEIGRLVKAYEPTQELMFVAYQEFYSKSETLNNSFEVGTSEYNTFSKKINDRLSLQLKEILNDEQYAKFLEISNQ